jgi:hypothetical protein
MPALGLTVLVAACVASAAPEKQSWESTLKPAANASFWPRSALVEIDGKAVGRGSAALEVGDPKRTFRIRVSAAGFETEEAVVEAGRIANRQFLMALRPAGFAQRVDPADPVGMALAAAALWRAGRADDAAEYAEQSLSGGNTPLANRVLGDVWRSRGDRDRAIRYYTMYLSLSDDPPGAAEIRAWLLQPRPGDIALPER